MSLWTRCDVAIVTASKVHKRVCDCTKFKMSVEDYETVDPVVFEFYQASHVARNLLDESRRLLKAEDVTWQSRNAKSLTNIVLECIAANFQGIPAYWLAYRSWYLSVINFLPLQSSYTFSNRNTFLASTNADWRSWCRHRCRWMWRQMWYRMADTGSEYVTIHGDRYRVNDVGFDDAPNVGVLTRVARHRASFWWSWTIRGKDCIWRSIWNIT